MFALAIVERAQPDTIFEDTPAHEAPLRFFRNIFNMAEMPKCLTIPVPFLPHE